MSDILFGQINLHKGYAGTDALIEYLSCPNNQVQTPFTKAKAKASEGNQSFVVAIQEPPVNNGKIKGFSRMNTLLCDQSAEIPRTAIYASKDIKLWLIPEFTSADVTTCIWKMGKNREVYLVSVYMDILHQQVIPDPMRRLMRRAQLRSKEVLIMADTNAHSTLWGCPTDNKRGELLEEYIFANNIAVLNKGDHFTFFNRRSATIIDVTLSTVGLADEIKDWKVVDDIQGSDHLLITWKLTISPEVTKKVRNWKLGDWSVFQKHMEQTTPASPTYWTTRVLDKEMDSMTEQINEALNKSHPPKPFRQKKVGAKWWNVELTDLYKKVKRAFSHFRKHRTEETHDLLVRARRDFSHATRRAKRKEWQRFCAETGDQKKASLLNKIIKRKEIHELGILHRDGKSLETAEASMDFLLETHFPRSSSGDHVSDAGGNERSCRTTNTAANFITVHKVREALDSFGDYKAPGPDGLPPVVLKNLGSQALARLTEIYKASYLLQYLPKVWRKARVIFIPKEGKKDYSMPRSFRPITLSSFLVKGMERVLLWELNATTLAINPLSRHQHAFRRGKSTETALSNMVEYIEKALVKRKFALGVFLDIQGAFDNVQPESIIQGMITKGINSNLIKWYHHYLLNRVIAMDHKGIKMSRHLTLGTPQGGVLSPIMWNLVFESLIELFEEGSVKICGFADDAGLVISGSDPEVLRASMQEAVDKALQWGREAGLTFSPLKTVSVLFTRKRKFDFPPTITMEGEEIPYSNQVRYLGIILDHQLTWVPHIKNKVNVAKGHMLKLKNAMGKLWGTPPKLTRWLYTGIVRPALTYGSLVWGKACETEQIKRELNKLNRLALLSMGHFRRSSPTAGLEVITNVMPLHLWIKCEAATAYIRTQGNNVVETESLYTTKGTLKGHRQIHREFLQEIEFTEVECDFTTPYKMWQKNYKLNEDSMDKGLPPNRHLFPCIYTDGSRLNDSTGSGVVIYEDGKIQMESPFYLGQHSSVFQGEVYAIKKAAEWIIDQRRRNNLVDIYVDSQAALRALTSCTISSKLVAEAIELLNRAGEQNFITLHWIKAHAGHPGNERADEIAKMGAQDRSLLGTDRPNVPSSMIKRSLKGKFTKKWNDLWQARIDCRQTKQWFPTVNPHKSFKLLQLDRTLFSHMVQLITGHNFLKRHESLVNDGDDDECRLCLEDQETSYHVFAECPALAGIRRTVLGDIFRADLHSLTIYQATSFFREAHIGRLTGRALE